MFVTSGILSCVIDLIYVTESLISFISEVSSIHVHVLDMLVILLPDLLLVAGDFSIYIELADDPHSPRSFHNLWLICHVQIIHVHTHVHGSTLDIILSQSDSPPLVVIGNYLSLRPLSLHWSSFPTRLPPVYPTVDPLLFVLFTSVYHGYPSVVSHHSNKIQCFPSKFTCTDLTFQTWCRNCSPKYLSSCVDSLSNRLLLNSGTPHTLPPHLWPVSCARCRSDSSLPAHVTKAVSTCFGLLCQICSIRRCFTPSLTFLVFSRFLCSCPLRRLRQ